jgi:hypothetical protein
MKKVVGILAILFTAAFLPAVSAEEKPAIAIIDTAVDTSKVKNVVYEVCILYEIRCPNKNSFMEGPGAASLPAAQLYKNGFEHGTIMSLIASAVNKDMNIVFIRVVSMTNTGRQGYYDDKLVDQALKWVAANKTRFNIVAVSASVGSHQLKSMPNYCPINTSLRNTIISLQNIGVATIFAAGNNYDIDRVDYPACISEAIAVGSTGEQGNVELYSNGGKDIDFYALGTYNTSVKRAMGTSAATAALAGYWAKSYKGNYQATYDYLKSIAKPAENTKVKTNLFVNILG